MAITFVDFTDSGAAATSPVSAAKPAGVVSGDKMVAFCFDFFNSGLTLGAPAGWVQIGATQSDPGVSTFAMYYKDDLGTAGPYSFTSTGSMLQVVIVAYRGATTGALDRSNPQQNTTAATSAANAGVTPTAGGETIISFVWNSTATYTATGGYTQRANNIAGQAFAQDRIGAPSGATGAVSVGLSASAPSDTWVLALVPVFTGHMRQRMVL